MMVSQRLARLMAMVASAFAVTALAAPAHADRVSVRIDTDNFSVAFSDFGHHRKYRHGGHYKSQPYYGYAQPVHHKKGYYKSHYKKKHYKSYHYKKPHYHKPYYGKHHGFHNKGYYSKKYHHKKRYHGGYHHGGKKYYGKRYHHGHKRYRYKYR